MRVFVTGCAGYIGSVLCDVLSQRDDYYVMGMDNFRYNNQQAVHHLLGRRNFRLIRGCVFEDIKAYRAEVQSANVVIPLAAIVGAPACAKAKLIAQEVNAIAIARLCELLRNRPDVRIVLPNTNSGYGATDGNREVTENDRLQPISVYGHTKVVGESYVLSHSNTVVYRLATVFGASPRMRFDLMVNDFFAKLGYIGRLQIFEPQFLRNFVHVRDVCRAFIHACNPSMTPGIYNLGLPDANLTKWELGLRIAQFLGLGAGVVTQGRGEDPDKRNYRVSNAKVLATGFRFRYSLDDGFHELRDFCRMYTYEQIRGMGNV